MIYFTGQVWTHKHEFDWCVLALWNCSWGNQVRKTSKRIRIQKDLNFLKIYKYIYIKSEGPTITQGQVDASASIVHAMRETRVVQG